jgi:hypothetical protein
MAKSKKPVKKPAPAKKKAAAPAKKSTPVLAAKTKQKIVKPAVKAAPVVQPAKAEPAKKAQPVKEPAKLVKKPTRIAPEVTSGKAKKDAKKAKAKKEEAGDDDLLVNDDDYPTEDIPDLAEFDEDEEIEELVEEDDSVLGIGSEIAASNDSPDEIILTDAEGRRYCRVKDCDQVGVVEGYCRFHYLLLWKKIQVRRKILQDGKLQKYVEELTARYPDKFLDVIRKDLRTEKDFFSVIAELEIDESANESDFEEEAQNFIEEVRGIGDGGASGSISDHDDDY